MRIQWEKHNKFCELNENRYVKKINLYIFNETRVRWDSLITVKKKWENHGWKKVITQYCNCLALGNLWPAWPWPTIMYVHLFFHKINIDYYVCKIHSCYTAVLLYVYSLYNFYKHCESPVRYTRYTAYLIISLHFLS